MECSKYKDKDMHLKKYVHAVYLEHRGGTLNQIREREAWIAS